MEENKITKGRLTSKQGGSARATSMLENSYTPRNFAGGAANDRSTPMQQARTSQQFNNVSS